MNKEIFIQDENLSIVENQTGEFKGFKFKRVKVHVEDFFCMYLESWNDFKERDGGLKTTFTWCIIKSTFSRAGDKPEGNFFFVSDVVDYVMRNHQDKSIPSLRNDISNLCKRGFIFKVGDAKSTPTNPSYVKGKYMINPKYGIKGSISEGAYIQYTTEARVVE